MGLSDLQIVGLGDSLGISEPRANDMGRKCLGKLGLTARPQIVEKLRPRLDASPTDYPFEMCPQILFAVPVSRNDMLIPWRRRLERLH